MDAVQCHQRRFLDLEVEEVEEVSGEKEEVEGGVSKWRRCLVPGGKVGAMAKGGNGKFNVDEGRSGGPAQRGEGGGRGG